MRGIIFDMDGTLINSEKYWSLLPRIFLAHHGVELTDDEWESAAWRTSSYSRTLNNYLGLPECTIDMPFEQCAEWCCDFIFKRIYQSPDFIDFKPGAAQTLESAAALGLPMCLLSATEPVSLEYTVNRLKMARYFEFYRSTSEGLNKHSPEIFLVCAEQLGCRPEECLVIEDSLYAMRTAREAGCTVWAIHDDKHVNDVPEIRCTADRYFEDHASLATAFADIKREESDI